MVFLDTLAVKEKSTITASWSLFPGMTSTFLTRSGEETDIKSRLFLPVVGSSTVCGWGLGWGVGGCLQESLVEGVGSSLSMEASESVSSSGIVLENLGTRVTGILEQSDCWLYMKWNGAVCQQISGCCTTHPQKIRLYICPGHGAYCRLRKSTPNHWYISLVQ